MKTSDIRGNYLFVIPLLLSLFLAGCTGAETPTPTASPTATPSATATALPPTPTPTTAPTATAESTATDSAAAQVVSSGDRAAFISETYPDNSVLEAGEAFTKAFELRNAGSVTWGTDYALVRDETNPAGETLGVAEWLALPQAVGPGETLTLEIPLTAPEAPGTYTVYWTLRDGAGTVIPVDGVQRVWATIRVCAAGQDCSAPVVAAGGPSAGGVSLTFVEVTHEGGMIFVEYCITVANPGSILEYPSPRNRSIIIDGEEIASPESGTANPVSDPIPGYRCFRERPPVTSETFNQAESVILRIGKVEGSLSGRDFYENCVAQKPTLIAQYPGFNVECDPSHHNHYTSLTPPVGMSQNEAHQFFLDFIKGAIYGPWDLTIK